jgi:hypothetical protein
VFEELTDKLLRSELNMPEIEALIKEADIQSVLMASFNIDGPTSVMMLGGATNATTLNAMSLSKPVFAYLMLTLIADEKVKFNLDTKLWTIFPEMLEKFPGNEEHAKNLTARYILSHQTGLPVRQHKGEALEFYFEPGKGFGYSNPAIQLLQKIIETVTKKDLETLAQENVFTSLGMKNSSFFPGGQAENGLRTTAIDYALFVKGWMNALVEGIKRAHENPVSLTKSRWAMERISSDDVQKMAWGLGWLVQKNEKNEVIGLSHWGDGSNGENKNFRAFVAFDMKGNGIVCLTEGKDGFMLLPKVRPFIPNVHQALENIVFKMLGFSRNMKERKTEGERVGEIILKYEVMLPTAGVEELKRGINQNSNKSKADESHKSMRTKL